MPLTSSISGAASTSSGTASATEMISSDAYTTDIGMHDRHNAAAVIKEISLFILVFIRSPFRQVTITSIPLPYPIYTYRTIKIRLFYYLPVIYLLYHSRRICYNNFKKLTVINRIHAKETVLFYVGFFT